MVYGSFFFYTNSLVNADLFYKNLSNTTFHLTRTYYEMEIPSLMRILVDSL